MSYPVEDANNAKRFKTAFGKGTEVPISTFLDTLLPPLHSEIDLDALVNQKFDSGRAKLPVMKDGRLWGFGTRKPSEIKGSIGAVFKSLQTCVGRLSKAVKGLEQRYEYKNRQRAKRRPKEEEDELPDAYLVLRSRDNGLVDWSDVAVPGAYNKSAPKDNRVTITKITELMYKYMGQDPRRRFTYGFTVVDTSMSLWYCDRSQILAFEPFNFVSDWRTLFHFILSIMYAGPHEVGFDPTTTLLTQEDGTARYDILVRSETGEEQLYRTLELLHDQAAEYLLGRGTRVWKAMKIEHGKEIGEPVALKDAWVDHFREREGDIDTRIRNSVVNGSQSEALSLGLLTIVSHGDVLVAGAQDSTRSLPVDRTIAGDDPVAGGSKNSCSPYQVHYRLVYKEVGMPLHSVTSLSTAFRALRDVTRTLVALHRCGWVHGDISLGNILVFDKWSKLADLEYAEQKDLREPHNGMGTDYFVSAEVRAHRYLFEPIIQSPFSSSNSEEGESDASDVSFESFQAEEGQRIVITPTPPALPGKDNTVRKMEKKPLIYHPLHDLESLWWVAVYFVVDKDIVIEGQDRSSAIELKAQKILASDLFWTGRYRKLAIADEVFFDRSLSCLHPSIQHIGNSLELVRQRLVAAYRKAERDTNNIKFGVGKRVYREFGRHFFGISEDDVAKRVEVRPLRVE